MIQIGVGLSQQKEAVSAVREASKMALNQAKIQNADWVLVFLTTAHIPHAEQIRQTVEIETQCHNIAGCSGSGILTHNEEIIGNFGLAVMVGECPGMESKAFIHRQEYQNSPSISQQLKETLESFDAPSPLVLLFVDAYHQWPYNIVNTLNYVRTKPRVFGAGACDDGSRQHSVAIGPGSTFTDGVSGLCFGGANNYIIGVTQSCTPIGEPLFITKVEENVIVTLDGYPALEVFATLASKQGFQDFDTAAQQVLIGFPLNKDEPVFTGESCLVRQLDGIDVSNQGLVVSEIVEEGGVLSLMLRSPVTAEHDLHQMLGRIKTAKGDETPVFGIYLNCSARGEALYGRPNVDTEAIRDSLGEFPIIGFSGGFELATVPAGLQLYSYTGVLVLFYT
ncbi:MAG: FIST C-terminal domain-containing protein [SAR324 cluster bacterium]|nr:FIST C-terminal domain-containing protein [SAR324 cluster bacterium]